MLRIQIQLKFVEEFITCKNNRNIAKLIPYQIHKHNRSCKKKSKRNKQGNDCRFDYPKLPMSQNKNIDARRH